MDKYEELKKAAAIAANNLIGNGFDSLKPMSADFCHKLGNFLWDVIEGKSVEQAAKDNQ